MVVSLLNIGTAPRPDFHVCCPTIQCSNMEIRLATCPVDRNVHVLDISILGQRVKRIAEVSVDMQQPVVDKNRNLVGPVIQRAHGVKVLARLVAVCRWIAPSIEIQGNSVPWSISSDAEWNLYFEFRAWIQDVCFEATLYLAEKEI